MTEGKDRASAPTGMRKALHFLGITFGILVVCTFFIWGFQTDWGKVRIERQSITAADGSTVSTLVYFPSSATAENKAPAIVINHGRSNQAHSNDTWSMELARRGYVVLSPDLFGGGESTTGDRNAQSLSITKYAMTLPMVDSSDINLIGYSAGCGTSLKVAQRLPGEIHSVLEVFGPFIVSSALGDNTDLGKLGFDFGVIKSTADQYDYNFIGDPESCRQFMEQAYASGAVASGTYLTSGSGHSLYYQEVNGTLHQTGNISGETIDAIINYEQNISPAPTPKPSSDQIWLPQQIFSGIACVDLMFLFVALVQLMLEMPFFRDIRNERPKLPARKGALPWVLDLILGILIPTVLFVPVSAYFMLWTGAGTPLSTIFTSANFNGIVGWLLVAIGLVGIIRIAATAHIKKKNGGKLQLSDLALAGEGEQHIRPSVPLKAGLIGAIVIAIIFIWLAAVEGFLGINYQVWNLSDYLGVSPERFVRAIPYCVLIFIVMMIGCSAQRILPSTGNERRDTWIAVAVDTVLAALPLFILLFMQYGGSLMIGTGETILPQMDIYGNGKNTSVGTLDFAFGYCYMMGGTTGAVTYLYRKYGNIWVGVIPAAIFAGMITLMSFTIVA